MKHIKKHPVNDKAQKLSTDIKKQDHSKPTSKKKLDADKSLSNPEVSMKTSKSSNRKLDGEKFLSENIQENSVLKSKLDEVYELIKEIIKSSDIEDFYQAEEIIYDHSSDYLRNKLWSDDELSDWMKKKEFGE